MEATEPKKLYHTTLTVTNRRGSIPGLAHAFYILGTHGDLAAAQAFAERSLEFQGYIPEDFIVYDEHAPESWSDDTNTVIYAKGLGGQEYRVRIEAGNNAEKLPNKPDGTIRLPDNEFNIYYVVLTEVDKDSCGNGLEYTDEIEGCYVHSADALEAARRYFKDQKEIFVEYDEKTSLDEEGEWPFGDDEFIHVVTQTGENFSISIKSLTFDRNDKEEGSLDDGANSTDSSSPEILTPVCTHAN